MKFSTQRTFNGIFTTINPVINKKRITMDGKVIPEIRQDGSKIYYGDFSDSHNGFYINDKIYLRIPWGRLNVTDPSSFMVLDDNKKYQSLPIRDKFNVVKTDGFVISGIIIQDEKVIDIFPGKDKIQKLIYKWKGWDTPSYRERLKKSYYIIKDAFAKLK
ncbi:hypothetical protein ACAG39_00315 [Caldicellulosiruptoraceae bacterium PP1]